MNSNFCLILDIFKSISIPVFISIFNFLLLNTSEYSFKINFHIIKEYIKSLYIYMLMAVLLSFPFYSFIFTYNSFLGELELFYLRLVGFVYLIIILLFSSYIFKSKIYKQFKSSIGFKDLIEHDIISVCFLSFLCIPLKATDFNWNNLIFLNFIIVVFYIFVNQSYKAMFHYKMILKNKYYEQLKNKMKLANKLDESGFFVTQKDINNFLIEGIALNVFNCNISIKKLKNLKYDEKQYVFYSEYLLEQLENDNLNFKTTFK